MDIAMWTDRLPEVRTYLCKNKFSQTNLCYTGYVLYAFSVFCTTKKFELDALIGYWGCIGCP